MKMHFHHPPIIKYYEREFFQFLLENFPRQSFSSSCLMQSDMPDLEIYRALLQELETVLEQINE